MGKGGEGGSEIYLREIGGAGVLKKFTVHGGGGGKGKNF